MGRLPELWLEPRRPAFREPLRQILDLLRLKLRLPVEEPGAVHDMGGLGGQVVELVREL